MLFFSASAGWGILVPFYTVADVGGIWDMSPGRPFRLDLNDPPMQWVWDGPLALLGGWVGSTDRLVV